MSKHPPSPSQPPYVMQMNSRMGRSLLVYDTFISPDPRGLQRPLTVGTSHLESLDSQPLREAQLAAIHNHFEIRRNTSLPDDRMCFVVGDFNFDDERNFVIDHRPQENLFLERTFHDYYDVWRELKPHDKGKTFDTSSNAMIFPFHSLEIMRYDRIMFTRPRDLPPAAPVPRPVVPLNISMIGTEIIDEIRGNPVVLSDHFGLFAEFGLSS